MILISFNLKPKMDQEIINYLKFYLAFADKKLSTRFLFFFVIINCSGFFNIYILIGFVLEAW